MSDPNVMATLAKSAVDVATAAPVGRDSTREIPQPDLSAVDFEKFEIIPDKLVPEERSAIITRFEKLGQVSDVYSPHRNFTHVLLQVAHQEQQVRSVAPAFRIVRFAKNERTRRLATRLIEGKTGIKVGALQRNGFALICRRKEDQAEPTASHTQDKIRQISNHFIEESWLSDMEFMASRYYRSVQGDTGLARKMQDAFIRNYNTRSWVQYMRRRHKVHEDVTVVPGAHREAETQSQQLRAKARKEKKKAEIVARRHTDQPTDKEAEPECDKTEPEDDILTDAQLDAMAEEELLKELDAEDTRDTSPDKDEETGTTDDDMQMTVERIGQNAMKELPPDLLHNDQKFATISFLMERGPDMECLVMVHGMYRTLEEAENHLPTVDRDLSPMQVHVVELGQWIFPLDMLWENSHLSDRVEGLKESSADPRVKINQDGRADAVKSTRKLRGDITRRKEMDERVREQLCERMGMTDEQLMAILDDAQLGTDAVISVCKIENDEQRLEEAQRILNQVGVDNDST
jgi:hypothetical protein